jgi:hypothetical protein
MNTSNNPQLLDVLTREGVLINVSVRYWRAQIKLRPQDLGLEDERISHRLISLGHKKLLPKEAFAPFSLMESRAHSLVEAATFPFLGGIARFLPNAQVAHVREKLADLQQEFLAEKARFIGEYEHWQTTALDEWRTFARQVGTPENRLLTTISAAFPSTGRVSEKFGFETRLFQVALPESLREESTSFSNQEAIRAARESVAREAAQNLRRDTETFVADCVATLREQTAEICQEMLASMDSGKTDGVHQKTLNRLVRFIEQFKSLNFAGDTELEEQLEGARRDLLSRTAEEYRDSAYARRQLVGGLSALKDRARELARSDAADVVQRFGEMGKRKFHFAA